MKVRISIEQARHDQDLRGILSLQKQNLKQHVSHAQQQSDGFVSVMHSLEVLRQMNQSLGQIIAKEQDTVIAYALAMSRECEILIPMLIPMFETINQLSFQDIPLAKSEYYVMGQICVADNHRGTGLFRKLYHAHRKHYAHQFQFCITEVSTSNVRSMNAHEAIGFKNILSHQDKTDSWNILLWDWSEKKNHLK